jgi:arylformamidase
VTDYRASFDAIINFSNGGDLTVHGFRIDVPGPDVSEAEIAALFVASLGLLMTDTAELSNVRTFAEPHKGTRAGPSDHKAGGEPAAGQLVELSHVIRAGMITYPGLPGPQITPYMTREASRERYAPGTEFAIDQLTLVGNTGTYLDAPYHRFPTGADLSSIALARCVDVPAVVVRVTDARQRGIDAGALAALDVRGEAVLLHTGEDIRFGTPGYGNQQHFLTRAGAVWLADHGAALVGIDGVNIDDTADGERPAHTLLLSAGIPIVEHLTGLDQLPPTGAQFTAVPLRIAGFGTIPVRAFARLPLTRHLATSR